MDENTRMMIQLASMMMQNENAIKETQKQLSVPTDNDDSTSQTNTSLNEKSAAAHSGGTELGMDSKLMAEFAKQIVMNANTKTGLPVVIPNKKQPSDKPATIAQLIQSQNLQKGQTTTANNSSEGKIFVYNKPPDQVLTPLNGGIKQEPVPQSPITNGNGLRTNAQRRTTIGPIRNRYGRVLRPGIDNYGRFEAVANPGLIMHAMELLRHKDKKKRGPKEKETFSVFMYCLPDKNSKLPKFSSLDPIERALVDQHQQEGYGYPSQDYINGIPRKTQLCLTFDDDKFHNFMIAIYPKLEGRLYDMYRIDKTRRLIRVEVKSPRQLKDMKYQGSVIVIPYDNAEDRPAPIIHRNFDECYNSNGRESTSLGNPLALMTKFNVPLPTLPELVSEATSVVEVTKSMERELPVFPGLPLPLTLTTKSPLPLLQTVPVSVGETSKGMETEMSDCLSNGHASDTDPFNTIRILNKASQLRSKLKETKRIHIKPESLFADILNAYRKDLSLAQHKLSICFQIHAEPNKPGIQHDDDVDAGSIIVMFWEEAFRKHFTGNQELVPVIDPSDDEDLFKLCGRILMHGLVLDNYLPLKLSQACLCHILTGSCSDRLLLTSLYRLMSDSEKEVLESSMEEIRAGMENFSPLLENGIKIILGSYGCRTIPPPYELNASMINIAKSYLIHRIYWPLQQMREGMHQSAVELFEDTDEEDVVMVYQVLTPHVPSIFSRVTYIYSESEDLQTSESESERKVKGQFEEYVFRLTKPALMRLLYQWCGFDCLCVTELFVRFSSKDEVAGPLFSPKQAVICLPSACASVDELHSLLENQLSGASMADL